MCIVDEHATLYTDLKGHYNDEYVYVSVFMYKIMQVVDSYRADFYMDITIIHMIIKGKLKNIKVRKKKY